MPNLSVLCGNFCKASSGVLIGPAFLNAATNAPAVSVPDAGMTIKPDAGLKL